MYFFKYTRRRSKDKTVLKYTHGWMPFLNTHTHGWLPFLNTHTRMDAFLK